MTIELELNINKQINYGVQLFGMIRVGGMPALILGSYIPTAGFCVPRKENQGIILQGSFKDDSESFEDMSFVFQEFVTTMKVKHIWGDWERYLIVPLSDEDYKSVLETYQIYSLEEMVDFLKENVNGN